MIISAGLVTPEQAKAAAQSAPPTTKPLSEAAE
jgi:hypothetical protein